MTQSILARTAAALTLGAIMMTVQVAPAIAANDKAQSQVELDQTPTGSINNLKTCDPNAADADIVCRVTKGKSDVKFPSAPTGPFGI